MDSESCFPEDRGPRGTAQAPVGMGLDAVLSPSCSRTAGLRAPPANIKPMGHRASRRASSLRLRCRQTWQLGSLLPPSPGGPPLCLPLPVTLCCPHR